MLDRTGLTIAAPAVMTPPKQPPVDDPGLGDPVAAMAALLRAAPAAQASILLVFLAAFVQEEGAVDPAALDALPEGMKPTVLRFFKHCLHVGLTVDELGLIAGVVRACEAGSHQVH
jgi:hypothetical protein